MRRTRNKKTPCIVKDLSDQEATILMVDSNLQRDKIIHSEKSKDDDFCL